MFAPSPVSDRTADLRAKLKSLQSKGRADRAASLGDPRVDHLLPGGGLTLGCWHEIAGAGVETEVAAATAAFCARLAALAAQGGEVVWAARRADLYAPGLLSCGLRAGGPVVVEAPDEAAVLAAVEDALGVEGVGAAVGEVGALDLTAGRRLQLACERRGATAFLLRRSPWGRKGGARTNEASSAAATRWRIEPAPSVPRDGEPGLGPPRWAARLERCRGGRTGGWIFEADDDAFSLRVVAELADHATPSGEPFRRAAG